MAPTTRSPQGIPPAAPAPDAEPGGFDEISDLTDRRRVLLLTLFGVAVSPHTADAVFDDVAVFSD